MKRKLVMLLTLVFVLSMFPVVASAAEKDYYFQCESEYSPYLSECELPRGFYRGLLSYPGSDISLTFLILVDEPNMIVDYIPIYSNYAYMVSDSGPTLFNYRFANVTEDGRSFTVLEFYDEQGLLIDNYGSSLTLTYLASFEQADNAYRFEANGFYIPYCPCRIPDGNYYCFIFADLGQGYIPFLDLGCFSLKFEETFSTSGPIASVPLTPDEQLAFIYDDEADTTYLGLYPAPDDLSLYEHINVLLIPVGSSTPSLSDYVTPEALTNLTDEVVSILPIVFVAFVSYLAIRKAIAWLQDILHNS